MNRRRAPRLVALALLVISLLACDISSLSRLVPSSIPDIGVAPPTNVGAGTGQSSQAPDSFNCDPQKLSFPLLPDARNCRHVDIITNFQSDQSPKDAIVIYNELLAKDGWTRKDDGTLPGMGSWVKGTRQLNVIASVEKGATSVQIQELGAAAPLPTGMARSATPLPTNLVRGVTPTPGTTGRGATPMPTSRIRVPPAELTAAPQSGELEGDSEWTGMGAKGEVINFCVYRNNMYRVHVVTGMTCRDKQTRETYSQWFNISPSDLPPFGIYPEGSWNVSGEYTIPDGVYKDVTVGIVGYLRGSQGRLFVDVFSENDVVLCEMGAQIGSGYTAVINVRRINVPCGP